jgi:hypothetical protein
VELTERRREIEGGGKGGGGDEAGDDEKEGGEREQGKGRQNAARYGARPCRFARAAAAPPTPHLAVLLVPATSPPGSGPAMAAMAQATTTALRKMHRRAAWIYRTDWSSDRAG